MVRTERFLLVAISFICFQSVFNICRIASSKYRLCDSLVFPSVELLFLLRHQFNRSNKSRQLSPYLPSRPNLWQLPPYVAVFRFSHWKRLRMAASPLRVVCASSRSLFPHKLRLIELELLNQLLRLRAKYCIIDCEIFTHRVAKVQYPMTTRRQTRPS